MNYRNKSRAVIFVLAFLMLNFLLAWGNVIIAQCDSIAYSFEYKFKDGVYASVEEFKKNKPVIEQNQLVYNNPEMHSEIYDCITNAKVKYYDSLGNKKTYPVYEIWGICSNGKIYFNFSGYFYRFFKIGSISYFSIISDVSYNDETQTYYKFPFYNKDREYMVDMKTGECQRFKLKKFLTFLSGDKELYEEFLLLKSRRKMNQQKFIFLNKYNERNPLYVSSKEAE